MPTSYPLDLTGNASTNLITNELHTFNTAADRIFPLTAGPFYTIGLEVYHGVTNQLLQPITQYKALHLHRDASLVSGKEVCAVIIVEDALIPSVRVKYHCIGGLYSNEASLIQDLIDNNPIANDDVVWGQIIGIPVQFPPAEHLHHFDNIYGAEEMVAVLERIRMAIAAGDSPAIAAIYQYIHTLLTNLNFQTEQQVIDLIGDTNVQYVKTYDSYTELRAETNVINNESYLYIATGKGARNDRKGRIFMWDITSMAVDDNDKALRPDHILETNPGRFIAMLDVELDLKNALATLGRRIEANGTVNADLGVVNRIESVSMNSLITPGDYWIHSNCTSRPDNTETLALKVWRESDTVIGQQAQCLYSTENYPHNRQGITYSRVSLDGGTTWSAWHETFTVARAVANGLDVDLATTNATNADLNTLVRTGKYWFGNTNAHRPEYNPGLYMEYAQLEVVCLNSTDVMQRAFNTSLEAYRYGYGGTAYAEHSWSPWEFRAARNGDTTQTFAMYSPDINAIDPSHGVNAAFLATQFATLWARLTANGIDAAIGVTNVLPAYTDLDGVITVGKYWFDDSQVNRPFNWGILEVELVGGTIDSPYEVIHTARWDGRVATRSRNYLGMWGEWRFIKNRDLGYERPLISIDLNTIVEDDNYACTTCTNAPETNGILTVKRETSVLIYQTFHSSTNTVYTRTTSDGGVTWTLWKHCVESGALGTTPEINIGVVIRYFGQQSLIMPCFIGEKEVSGYTNTDVYVFISGEYKTISLNNIKPLMPSLITGPTKRYIYLVEESAGVYVLEAAAQKPTFIPQDSSVFPRKPMFFPGTVQATSNKLFIGMCLIENSHYIVTRSWFKDPGFMEHYQSYYTRPDDLRLPHLITERVSGGVKKLNIPSALQAFSLLGASQMFTYLSDPPVFPEDLTPAIPLLAWGGETVRLSYTLSVVLDSTFENYARGGIFIEDDETVYDSHQYQIPYIECRSSVISRNAINAYANSEFFTVSGETANVKPHDHGIAIRLYGQIHDAGCVFKIGSTDQLNGFSEIVLTLCSVQTFRSLLIHTVSAAMWFTGPRVITLPATTLFDLNLKTYHDMIYGGAAPANSSVEFIVPNGCLVTASTTSLYAITNPNSWASGVTTKIKVEAGGFVAGRGGNGGRGGRAIAQYVDSDGDTYTTYFGGDASNPSSVVHGKKGGNAIRTFRALVVENLGFIGVGSGGGGASGGGVIGFSSTGTVDRIAVSGNGGGGGWPLGLGGRGGQIRLDDSSQAEYYQNEGSGGFNAWHVSGNPGESAGGYGSHTTLASGGTPISRTNGNSVLSHGAGGGGGLSALTQYSAGGGGSSWTNVSWVQVGDAGTGGNEGDYAINATGGSVTFVGPSGDIRGLVI